MGTNTIYQNLARKLDVIDDKIIPTSFVVNIDATTSL